MPMPQHDEEDIPSSFGRFHIGPAGIEGGNLLAIKDTSVHALIDARALCWDHSACRRRAFRRLAIHSTRYIFSTDCEITSCNVRFVSPLELLLEAGECRRDLGTVPIIFRAFMYFFPILD